MNHHYADIRDRLGEPKWWDEHAVPRYCDFRPQETANIYAKEACLLLIECQGCETPFRVCLSSNGLVWVAGEPKAHLLADSVRDGTLHYGDPPNASCCPAGPTMNSVPRRVLEFWRQGRETGYEWQRLPELEIGIGCEWSTTTEETT